MSLPVGVVTFLFTDLEESTRQWERHPAAMRDALVQHDAIMQAAIAENGGALVKHTGDGVCAVFRDAADAAAACVAAQRALKRMPAGDVVLRSRMALHTGEAELQGADYRGTVLNRAARLMAAAHGGQVLASQATREAIGERLPSGVRWRHLGSRRLRDIPGAGPVFQLAAEDLPSEFPPLRTLDARRLDIPAPATPFIGRTKDLDVITAAFERGTTRLLTLTGIGGTGKSRLAIEAARRLVDGYADGASFVPLAAVTRADMVLPAIAKAFDVRETGDRDLAQALRDAIRDRHLLLVLDNFEQVVEAAPVVGMMLEAAPRLHVLVTSREALRIAGEREHPVAPLVPDEAVALFVDRAQAVKPDVRLDGADARDIADICLRVDGIPLAIELAAARVRVLPFARMRTMLDERLRFLTGGSRDAPERHRTLRAMIDWSFRLLDAHEQTLFGRLAVFVDGAALDAIETVCGSAECPDVLRTLESLVAKSLVRQADVQGEARFEMLETLQEYAREQLAAAPDATRIETAHADYYLALAEHAAPRLNDVEQAAWLRKLDAEDGNLRAALARCRDTGDVERGLRLCKALHRFWTLHGRLSEGRQWCSTMLERSAGSPPSLPRVATANALAVLALHQNDYDVARPLLEECAQSLRAMGDARAASRVLNNLGVMLEHVGDLRAARKTYEESLAIKRDAGDPSLAVTLGNLANVLVAEGEVAQARALLAQALAQDREHGSPESLATTLCKLARAARKGGDYGIAQDAVEESLVILRRMNATGPLAEVLAERGDLAIDRGMFADARGPCADALAIAMASGDRGVAASALEGLGFVALADGDARAAVCAFATGDRIREEIRQGPTLDAPRRESALASARAALGEQAFDEAWREGRAQSLASAADAALRIGSR